MESVDRKKLRQMLDVPESLVIELVVALGYPAENPVVDVVNDGDTWYWLAQDGVLHVPKLDLKDVVQWNKPEQE
jgi:hypothetical protein